MVAAVILVGEVTSWQDVSLVAINVTQVVALAWIGRQQVLSARERENRSERERIERGEVVAALVAKDEPAPD